MLSHENGPVLIIAATSLTLPNNQEPFAQSLIHARIQLPGKCGQASVPILGNVGGDSHAGTLGVTTKRGKPGCLVTAVRRPWCHR